MLIIIYTHNLHVDQFAVDPSRKLFRENPKDSKLKKDLNVKSVLNLICVTKT